MRALIQFIVWAVKEIQKAYDKWKREQAKQQELLSQSKEIDEQVTPDEHIKVWICKKCGKNNSIIYKVACLWCGNPRME